MLLISQSLFNVVSHICLPSPLLARSCGHIKFASASTRYYILPAPPNQPSSKHPPVSPHPLPMISLSSAGPLLCLRVPIAFLYVELLPESPLASLVYVPFPRSCESYITLRPSQSSKKSLSTPSRHSSTLESEKATFPRISYLSEEQVHRDCSRHDEIDCYKKENDLGRHLRQFLSSMSTFPNTLSLW